MTDNNWFDIKVKAQYGRIQEMEATIREYEKSEECWNAVLDYVLGKGCTEEPLEFLRCWNEGDFDLLRTCWPDAPKEIYYTDPLYKSEKGETK